MKKILQLEKNNIKAVKGKWGTYIDIHDQGAGDKISYNSVVSVNYTGKTLDSGKVFDSNVDPKFKHAEPFEVSMSQVGSGLILGWTDALMELKNGSKATVYIPSSLAYGKNGNPPKIGPDAILVFDMEVKSLISEDQAMEKATEKRKQTEQMQQHMLDSLKNANPVKK